MMLVMLLTGCSTENTKTIDTKNAVFTIEKDGKTVGAVSKSYAWLYTLMYKDSYESWFGSSFWEEETEDGTTYGDMFKEEMINDMKQAKVLRLEAEENGVTLDDEEKSICASNAKEYLEEIEEDTLKKTGITEEIMTEYLEDYTIYDKYKEKLLENEEIEISEDEVRQSDLFVLTFSTLEDDGETQVSEEKKAEVKKKADVAYQLLQAGKDIEKVAEKYGLDPEECQWTSGRTAEADQDEYYDKAFEDAAYSLEEGEISKVTECNDGYYIIKMITKDNEEETAAAMEEAEQNKADELFAPMLEKMDEKYDITMNESNWDEISFSADIGFIQEETGDDAEELIPEEDSSEVVVDEPVEEEE